MIVWQESSATEPGGTACDGRTREFGAADVAAMPVVGSVTLVSLPQAGRGQCGGSCIHSADRSALFGPALLRLAPGGGMGGDPTLSRQPQAGAAPDAAAGGGGDLSAPRYAQGGGGAPDTSPPAARACDRAAPSGLVLRP